MMKIKVEVLSRNPSGDWAVVHAFITDYDDIAERRHLGFLCRYLFECGLGVKTTPL